MSPGRPPTLTAEKQLLIELAIFTGCRIEGIIDALQRAAYPRPLPVRENVRQWRRQRGRLRNSFKPLWTAPIEEIRFRVFAIIDCDGDRFELALAFEPVTRIMFCKTEKTFKYIRLVNFVENVLKKIGPKVKRGIKRLIFMRAERGRANQEWWSGLSAELMIPELSKLWKGGEYKGTPSLVDTYVGERDLIKFDKQGKGPIQPSIETVIASHNEFGEKVYPLSQLGPDITNTMCPVYRVAFRNDRGDRQFVRQGLLGSR